VADAGYRVVVVVIGVREADTLVEESLQPELEDRPVASEVVGA